MKIEEILDNKIVLKGGYWKISPVSYPGRIYGKYIFDWIKYKWTKDENKTNSKK